MPASLCLNESWSFEELHDDMNAKVVNEIGVPVTLTQLLRSVADCARHLAVLQPEGIEASAAQAVRECEAGSKAAAASSTDEVLCKRKEKIRETVQQRRRAKTTPALSLKITQQPVLT